MIEHVLDRPHRRTRDALAEDLLPFAGGARGERAAQLGHEIGGMRGAALHRGAARIAGQLDGYGRSHVRQSSRPAAVECRQNKTRK
jgi:hypothetical protein